MGSPLVPSGSSPLHAPLIMLASLAFPRCSHKAAAQRTEKHISVPPLQYWHEMRCWAPMSSISATGERMWSPATSILTAFDSRRTIWNRYLYIGASGFVAGGSMIKLHTKQVACSIADGSFELEELGEDDSIYHYDQAHMDALNSTRPWKEDPNYFKKVRISGEHASPPWRHRLRLAPPPPCVGFPSSPPRPRQSAGRPAARKHAHAPRAVVSDPSSSFLQRWPCSRLLSTHTAARSGDGQESK